MSPAEALVAIFVLFGLPASIVWVVFRYKTLEKGLRGGGGGGARGRLAPAAQERLESLEKDKKLLEERVRNLESIVCSVDLELNGRLNRLALESRARSALPAATATAPTAAQALPAPITPGKVLLSRYHIERELGRGGMGAVYLARDAQLGEQVALKVISAHWGGEAAAAVERFRREASAARKITHPNVIRIHDLGEDPAAGELFLSMEYFPGMTLADLLRRRGALPLDEARDILGQVCDGLEAAHKAGVIHRDLKPGNILCNDRRQVKIIDFGLAKASFMAGMTATGLILGTPEYMAPEQVRGRDADGRTDIYALGAVAYHVVTGVPPFGGETPIAVGFAHCTQPVRPPTELRPDLPARMAAAIVRALSKEPRDRFDSVSEMRTELLAG
ncbi:MAG TPA: serine/threonine-protein kinase [Polyangia bacterium]|nr:serine/threonine-protein kinase [Polyangia bacterium]